MTKTTTAFQDWLDQVDDTDIQQISDLYLAITSEKEIGNFKCSRNDDRLFVTNRQNNLTLMLATERAVNRFLSKLDKEYNGELGSVAGYVAFEHAMRKDD